MLQSQNATQAGHVWSFNEHRRFPRVRLAIPIKVFCEGGRMYKTQSVNISMGGLCVAVDGVSQIPVGRGVAISFRMPNGSAQNEYGRVVWVEDSGEYQYHGIEFEALSFPAQETIAHYVEVHHHPQANEKYLVDTEGDNKLTIALRGFMSSEEGERLRYEIEQKFMRLPSSSAFVYIDLSEFAACNEECLASFRSWMSTIAKHRSVLGVIVGPSSTGVLQFMRITREAGVADVFVKVDNPLEAQQFSDSIALLNEDWHA